MTKLPSFKRMVFLISILAILASLKYDRKITKNLFQLNMDWDKEIINLTLHPVTIDSICYNYLKISNINPDFTPNNQYTYSIAKSTLDRHYFRFNYSSVQNNTVTFHAVEWLNGMPEINASFFTLTESDIPLKVRDGKMVVTIGNFLLTKDEAKYFRRKIATNLAVNFDGRVKDVFNFKHEATFSEDWEELWTKPNEIPEANIYIVMGNLKIDSLNNPHYSNPLKHFLNELSARKQTEKIIWILPPSLQNSHFEKIEISNQFISGLSIPKLVIVDSNSFIKDESYYMEDKIFLNKLGYESLADKITPLLK